MVPATFDFCLANLNCEASSAGISILSESLNPTARFLGSPCVSCCAKTTSAATSPSGRWWDLITGRDSQRAGRDRDHAAATFFALVNSHCYQLLARHAGRSPADWQQWLASVLDREFFGSL